jgi:hypothetical protein
MCCLTVTRNYHITPWLAEFWNTLSNIPFILMAAYGIYRVYQQRLPSSPRFAAAYGGMGLVGLGSESSVLSYPCPSRPVSALAFLERHAGLATESMKRLRNFVVV